MKTAVVAAVAAAALAGCAPQSVPGTAVDSPRLDPTKVAGLAITTGDSGLKPGAPAPDRQAQNSDGGRIDQLATAAVADVEQYWGKRFPEVFDEDFAPVGRLVSYDSRGPNQRLCGTDTAGLVNAFYCSGEQDLVAWDRGELLPSLDDISVVAVLAHEIGHAVQFRLGVDGQTPTIVKEQQADCYTGNYFRWVAEGKSQRFQLSTGPGLNQILATLFAIRDSAGTTFDSAGAHGTAFDRVTAFQFGFAEEPGRCAEIDFAEIQRRSTQQAFGEADKDQGFGRGNIKVDDQQALADLRDSLAAAFPDVPVRFDASCRGTSPAAYCQGAVGVDLRALVGVSRIGDFAAFGAVASRYALAVQDAAGLPVEGLVAGQRTACLTGLWASTIVRGKGAALELSPGDLDEAVVELLSRNSLIAGDVRGQTIPSGFARVEAFREGFLTGSADTCATRFRPT
ncbi:putative metalloprotease [Saccharothrix coeruleofusca]|uniref:neutral zinc metallopeptidase n=1 Tax=Saccharothrix coeruleofusca TaxID=33919 RepID=UPI001AEA924C|nr:neutral zinc metallopeptidase [Saccharothrix coeruleofusca]MBP2339567.1 putative metalloprotease [Saccharothrix coeruleofusca]